MLGRYELDDADHSKFWTIEQMPNGIYRASWGKIGLTTHVSGTLPVTNGGTGTATAFTAGSVVFAGASGVYSQNNSKFFSCAGNSTMELNETVVSGSFKSIMIS